MAFLQVEHLTQSVRNKKLLDDISCRAEKGTITALLGPNGAGKTTLLRTIIGAQNNPKPDKQLNRNLISINGEIVNSWPIHRRIAAGVVYLPQHSTLFTSLSVSKNLEIVFQYHPHWQRREHMHFLQERDNWLELAGLTQTLAQAAGTLSGGQKRKLEVVRSLLMSPRVLLLDEPFAGVDPKSIYELKKIFSMLSGQGVGLVVSDHHVDQLLSMAQTVYVIMAGQVVTQGTIAQVLTNRDTQDHYLGQQFYDEIVRKFLVQEK